MNYSNATIATASEKVFAEVVGEGSTARAAARDLEKKFLQTVAFEKFNVEKGGISEKLAKAVSSHLPAPVDQKIVEKIVSAISVSFSPSRPAIKRDDLLRQISAAVPSLPPIITRRIRQGVIPTLYDGTSSSDLADFLNALMESPSNAIRVVLDTKIENFVTRGLEASEIAARSKKELSDSLAKAIKSFASHK